MNSKCSRFGKEPRYKIPGAYSNCLPVFGGLNDIDFKDIKWMSDDKFSGSPR